MLEDLYKLITSETTTERLLAWSILFFAIGIALYYFRNSKNKDGNNITIQAAFDAIVEQAKSTRLVAAEIKESNSLNNSRNNEQAQHHKAQMELAEKQTVLLDKLVKEMETHNIKAKGANEKNLEAIQNLSAQTSQLVIETKSTGEVTRKMLNSIEKLNNTVLELSQQVALLIDKTEQIRSIQSEPVRLSNEDHEALAILRSNVDIIVSSLQLLDEKVTNIEEKTE